MPGNVKLGSSNEPDPDPAPYLYVSAETKRADTTKPYDAKKSCWVPNKASGGFDEGLIVEKEGEKVTVEILDTKEVSRFDRSCK